MGERVLIYPFDENPYQRLLVEECRRLDGDGNRYVMWRRLKCSPLLDFAIALLVGRLMRLRTLHLHWPDIISAPGWLPGSLRITSAARRALLQLAHRLGYDVVWTVHNLVPHAPRTADDRAEAAHLLGRCDLVFTHSEEVADVVAGDVRPGTPVVVIPHGNYVDEYRTTLTTAEARQQLGLDPDAFTFTFVGKVRRYKGVPELLAAWHGLRGDSRLVIAGESDDAGLAALLREVASAEGVTVRDRFLAPDEAAAHLRAADVVVFPFRTITTSGSLMLALSLGCAVVVPDLASLPAEVRRFAFTYDPARPDGLQGALAEAMAAPAADRRRRGELGLAYALAASWDVVARRTLDGYARIPRSAPLPGVGRAAATM